VKNITVIFFGILALFFSTNLYAQGETAVPFVLTSVSPNLNGMAGTFTALPSDDAYGAYYNPAKVVTFSQQNNFAFGFYPQKTDWLPGLDFGEFNFHAYALAARYKFKTIIPVNIGFSYIYSKFDLGENVWTDASGRELATFNSYESCSAFSLGIGIDYYLKFSLGLTYKDIYSKLVPVKIQNVNGIAEASAFDIGLLISAPISEFALPEELKNINSFMPIFDLSIGYSINNFGDEMFYGDTDQGDPLPRQSRLGYGLSLGLNYNYNDFKIRLIKFDFSTEARDFLAYRTGEYIKYKSISGDINFFRNVIGGNTSNEVEVYRGWRINLLNIFTYSKGRISSKGFILFDKSNGYSVNTKGIFDWLQNKLQDSTIKYITNHFSLEYSWAKYDSENEVRDNTVFKGIQLKIFGFY
jgi:hypothetical protein